jgi:hypothetical protein
MASAYVCAEYDITKVKKDWFECFNIERISVFSEPTPTSIDNMRFITLKRIDGKNMSDALEKGNIWLSQQVTTYGHHNR